jgi:IclR family transcriptional regulator, acetate operon repressor
VKVTAQYGTQAVDRAAELLVRVIDADRPQAFTALVAACGLPKSTTSRLLAALERQGLLQRDRDGAFRPGPVLLRYASHTGAADLIALTQPVLERLGEKTGETVNLAVPSGGAVEQIAQIDSRYLLGATNWVGLRVPLHCSALGKVFLAYGAATLPGGRLERRTSRTITSRAVLDEELHRVRGNGFAVARDELEPGLIAVAAPVHGGGGTVVAALSVSGPSVRLTDDRIGEVAALLVSEAATVSTLLDTPIRQEVRHD